MLSLTLTQCHCRGWHRLRTLRLLGADTLQHPLYLLPPLTPLPSTLSSLAVDFPVTADDASLEALGSMTQLTSLHLQLARGPHVLQLFGRLTQLQQLHMCAWVDDASNAWLPSSLQELTIAATEAGRCGCAWMDALQACSALRSLTLLELGWEDVDYDTVDLTACTQLTRVNGNINAPVVLANLPASLIVLQLTNGEGCEGVYPATPACRVFEDLPEGLAACTALEVLHLRHCGLLPPLPSLRSASLGVWAHAYDVAVVHSVLLTIPSNITSLDFAPCYCQDVSIQGLSHCIALRELSLDGGCAGFNLDFEHLRPLTALTKLLLYDTSESGQTPNQTFTLLHEEQLQLLPLQQLYVPRLLWECVRGSAAQRCEVIAL